MAKRADTADLLAALRELGDDTPPTSRECSDDGEYGPKVYQRRFGGWNEALLTAGYSASDLRIVDIPEEDLLADLRAVGDPDRPPTTPEYQEHGRYDTDTYKRRFGSWPDALDAAGYDPAAEGRYHSLSREVVLERLQRAAEDLGHAPSSYEIRREIDYISASAVHQKFENWEAALAAGGLNDDHPTECKVCEIEFDSRRAWKIHRTTLHDEDGSDISLLEAIHQLAEGDIPPTEDEMINDGPYSLEPYTNAYGSWRNALDAAGFGPRPTSKKYSREQLIEEMRRVADEVWHPPRTTDMKAYGEISVSTYESRFGGWIDAQRAAGVGTNKAKPGETGGSPGVYRGGWDTAREEALERDGYECQDCGLTDEEHRELQARGIHVHHIIRYRTFDDPESAHGLWNLLTLCWRCHMQRHNVRSRESYEQLKEEFAETVGCAPGSG
jgi:hypothetical protein